MDVRLLKKKKSLKILESLMEKNGCKVCVTGGAGYIGSLLIKKLLEKGHIVHATLRNLDDVPKASLLRSLPGSRERLVPFEADFYDPVKFEKAIEGCEFVFHVATPLFYTPNSKYKNTSEAAIAAAKSIVEACIQSETVKRLMPLIYTASMPSASPLKDDGSGFKDSTDETCWTSLDFPLACSNDFSKDYTISKTLAEKEILSYKKQNNNGLEIVSLVCGLVGGSSLLPSTHSSVAVLISQLTNNEMEYSCLRFLEDLVGKIPIVHVEDVCDAHIFCMESPPMSMNGRFFCTSSYVSSAQIAIYYQQHYSELEVKRQCLDLPKRQILLKSTKLAEKGFVYKYDTKMILDDCINCARKWGSL